MDFGLITVTASVVVGVLGAFFSWLFAFRARRERKRLEAQLEQETSVLESRLKQETTRRVEAELVKEAVGGGNIDVEALRRRQEERDEDDFKRNAAKSIVLELATFRGLIVLADGNWTMQPGMNVLFGRNGFGKSLLLRALAAALSRNFPKSFGIRTGGELTVALSVDGQPQRIVCGDEGFKESIGPVPLLAIPDSRFLNRTEDSLRPPRDPSAGSPRHGARHFLEQQPYNGAVEHMLHALCLDYWQAQSFDQPVFGLLTEAFKGLTDDSFRFVSANRAGEGETEFRLKVITEGNREPVLVQAASQGTLSVLTIFGLIYRFLAKLPGDKSITERRAIVIIDELDAHLHPSWQRRISTLLRSAFPNVQFIVSAHSPLLVAGCGPGEVSVMRKRKDGFWIETIPGDFVGAKAGDIYDTVFDVTDGDDEVFIEHSKLAGRKVDHSRRIEELQDKTQREAEEELELRRLRREQRLMRRALAVEESRAEEANQLVTLEAECSKLRIEARGLTARLEAQSTEATSPPAAASTSAGDASQ